MKNTVKCPTCHRPLIHRHDEKSSWNFTCQSVFCECKERESAIRKALAPEFTKKAKQFIKFFEEKYGRKKNA